MRKNNGNLKVVYAATRRLYPYVLPAMCSLLEYHPDAEVYLLTEDDHLQFDLPEQCRCINVSGQKWFPPEGPNYKCLFSYMVLLRTVYSKIFLRFDRVLSLDLDTIVVDPLDGLWSTDMTGKWFGACDEVFGAFKPFGPKYYNFGVLLMNLDEIRKDRADDYFMEILNANEIVYPEQTVWNYYGQKLGKAVELHPRYNVNFATSFVTDPAIIHYAAITDWMTRRDMMNVEYLDKYRHLFR